MSKPTRHIFHIYHPAVVFSYIIAALVFAMLTFQPLYVLITFICGSTYALYLNRWRQFRLTLAGALLIWLMIALLNPVFNQSGATVLFYAGRRMITRESLLYGIMSGGALASVLIWFSCYRQLMNHEKFLYIFNRVFPVLALMLSMISRLLPVTRYKARQILTAQKAMGIKTADRRQKLHSGIRASSILMSWTMEDSIETADSMRARGYGRQRRSTYSVFSWSKHDTAAAAVLITLAAGNLLLIIRQPFVYFPVLPGSLISAANLTGYTLHVLFLWYPVILEMRERLRWHY